MRLTVLETRACTIDINTTDQTFAEKMAMKVYKDNCTDNNFMIVTDTEIVNGTKDSVDMYLDKNGDPIWI